MLLPPTRPAAAQPAAAARVPVPPSALLARQFRGAVVESEHRGHIVVATADGSIVSAAGDPDRVVMLRSVGKPFALVALLTAHGVDALRLSDEELAVMAGSHSGEDAHMRVLTALVARAGARASDLVCGTDQGAPLDARTAARLARDGETPGRLRHQCSGQHIAFLLLARLGGWSPDGYWTPDHPAQRAVTDAVASLLGTTTDALPAAIDGCATQTYAALLRDVARLHAVLADPAAAAAALPGPVASALIRIRDAMLAHPRLLGGTGDRLDAVLMERLPGRVTVKVGAEGLAGVAVPPAGPGHPAQGIAIKIDDGDPTGRALSAVTTDTLHALGLLDEQATTDLSRFHTPTVTDSLGRTVARTQPCAAALLSP